MVDTFKYLSPREFQKLDAAAKDQYLAALYVHLHTAPHTEPADEPTDEAGPEPQGPRLAAL